MKIVSLQDVKVPSKVVIKRIANPQNEKNATKERIMALGFYPGKIMDVQDRRSRLTRVRPEGNNSYVVDDKVASRIMVEAQDSDVFEPDEKRTQSIFAYLKKLFSKKK